MHLQLIIIVLKCITLSQSLPMISESGFAPAAIGLGEEIADSLISHSHLP
jgi:hypothetical protein